MLIAMVTISMKERPGVLEEVSMKELCETGRCCLVEKGRVSTVGRGDRVCSLMVLGAGHTWEATVAAAKQSRVVC
jgi:hypothetical protein